MPFLTWKGIFFEGSKKGAKKGAKLLSREQQTIEQTPD